MKATQDKVLSALQAVAGIVERRHTLPILANVLIRKTGGQLELTTSDLEIQVRTSAELGGDAGDFSTTVGARNIIIDHCSFTWGLDENLSASGPRFAGDTPDEWREGTSRRISFSYNLLAEGLADSTHP